VQGFAKFVVQAKFGTLSEKTIGEIKTGVLNYLDGSKKQCALISGRQEHLTSPSFCHGPLIRYLDFMDSILACATCPLWLKTAAGRGDFQSGKKMQY
jgi:hypothetical protein